MPVVKAGRKRHSAIWDYFEYDNETNKSKCLVERETAGDILYAVRFSCVLKKGIKSTVLALSSMLHLKAC